jgi:hypothetical protein
MIKVIIFLGLFLVGEFLVNRSWFNYLKVYFSFHEANNNIEEEGNPSNKMQKFLFLNLSTFKGMMERFIITIGLIQGFAPILIVLGTIKLGTRFKGNQDIKNDYFLIGNFSSILISLLYYYIFNKLV